MPDCHSFRGNCRVCCLARCRILQSFNLVPKLRLGTPTAKLRFASFTPRTTPKPSVWFISVVAYSAESSRVATGIEARSRASMRAFPCGAWERAWRFCSIPHRGHGGQRGNGQRSLRNLSRRSQSANSETAIGSAAPTRACNSSVHWRCCLISCSVVCSSRQNSRRSDRRLNWSRVIV
jgi:hypothetical protein